MKQQLSLAATGAATALMAFAIACGGSRPTFSTAASGTEAGTIEVHLSAGSPIAGATVTVYAVREDNGQPNLDVGTQGVIGAGGPTDASGIATVGLSMPNYTGLIQVVASGSNLSFADPCTPAPSDSEEPPAVQIPADFVFSSYYASYKPDLGLRLPVNLQTTLADHELVAFAKGLHPLHPEVKTISAAIVERDPLFVAHITSSASAWIPDSFRTTIPAALGEGPQTLNEAALAAFFDVGVSSLAHRIANQAGYDASSTVINAVTLAQLLAQDLDADATFDGKGAGGAQLKTSGSTPVSLDAQTLRLPLANALDEFIYTPAVNKSGITRIDLSNAAVYDCIANDASDLFGAPPAGTFALERIPPSVAFDSLPAAANAPLAVRVRVTDTGAGIATVWVQLNDTEPVQATATSTAGLYQTSPLTLTPGTNTLVAWAIDNAQTSGEGQPSPATATAHLIFDNSKPDATYVGQFASYYDERGLTVATSGNVAVVPVQYVCSTAVHGCSKTAIPADRGISKVATRLGWTTRPTAAVLEGANPDNIPLLRWKVPYDSAIDAPIAKATYSVAVSCTGCSYPAATGDLWRSAATATDAVLFELPVASSLIPALTSLPSAATLAVTATFTDAAGNVATNTVSVPFHLLGPPLAVVPDSTYLTFGGSYRPRGGFYLSSATVANGGYVGMWRTSDRSAYHYTVSNPHSQSVAVNFPTATWTNKETWKAHRRQFTQWFKPTGHFAGSLGCQIPADQNQLGSPYSQNGQSGLAFPSLPSCATAAGWILAHGPSASPCNWPLYPTSGCVAAVDPLQDWGTISAGTSAAYSKFYYGDHELSVKANTSDYVIPGASAGAPAIVDVELIVASITRFPSQYPWAGTSGFAPSLPPQSCFGNGLGTAFFYVHDGNQARKNCDGTTIYETRAYYDYQYPDEIHDDITGSWSITPKALDAAFNEVGDPAAQQVLGLNYQIPHN